MKMTLDNVLARLALRDTDAEVYQRICDSELCNRFADEIRNYASDRHEFFSQLRTMLARMYMTGRYEAQVNQSGRPFRPPIPPQP
jgi:hypothetical protein